MTHSPAATSLSPATLTYLSALDALPGADVSRAVAISLAEAQGLPRPRWYYNTADFKIARGRLRKPTVDDCVRLNVGYGMAKRGRPAKHASSGATAAPKPRTVAAPAAPAAAPADAHLSMAAGRVPRSVPAPVAVPLVPVSALIRDDAANTAVQTEISRALGVDVLFGSSDDVPQIPAVDPNYVPWGFYKDLRTILTSAQFLPVMIVGPSGNGKSVTPEQICAMLGREYVRVNITKQTDEDDLIGGFRLVNGDTKFALGPVPLAMLRGAVLNLDEIDLGGAALMCLQSVLEGKPLYIKKIGRYITPAPGFTIVATANTKGRGDDGRYMYTNVMNDAMLERFAVMFEHGWPEPAIERKIVSNVLKSLGTPNPILAKHLVEFANITRKNFEEQVCEDQIATRRLLHLCRVFASLGNIDRALELTMARFDRQTAQAFTELWKAIHADPAVESPSGAPVAVTATPAEMQ